MIRRNQGRKLAFFLIWIVLFSCIGFHAPVLSLQTGVFKQTQTGSEIAEVLQSKPSFLMCEGETLLRKEIGRPTRQLTRIGRRSVLSGIEGLPVFFIAIRTDVQDVAALHSEVWHQTCSSTWILHYIHQQDGEKPQNLFS